MSECVEIVRQTDNETQEIMERAQKTNKKRKSENAQPFVNPSQRLVQTAIQRCCEKMIRADNTTAITIMLDSPLEENYSERRIPLNSLPSIRCNKSKTKINCFYKINKYL